MLPGYPISIAAYGGRVMPVQFRIVTVPSGKPWTDWRDTKEQAVEDAIAVELAERDDDDPATIYWDPLAMIEIKDGRGGTDLVSPR